MTKSHLLCFALLLVVCVSELKWYAQYDLSEAEITDLKKQGCYRGLFGGIATPGAPRTLSLTTCPTNATHEWFAITDDDAFLCVVELKHLVAHSLADHVANSFGAKVLFQGRQELVLVNSVKQSELPAACFLERFPNIADNLIYVPRRGISPERPTPADHPVMRKYVHKTEPAAPNPKIQNLINLYTQSNVYNWDNFFATDWEGGVNKVTRNSYAISPNVCKSDWKCPLDCSNYIIDQVTNWFAGYPRAIQTEISYWRSDMCGNTIVTIPGATTPNQIVVVGAHLDSRMAISSSTAFPAPGADDNGSGSAAILEMIRTIGTSRTSFANTLKFMWFCGEEQGLLGSQNIANSMETMGANVIAMFNADMIGYLPTGGTITLSFMSGASSSTLTNACAAIASEYMPGLAQGSTSACCSDQQSFNAAGFPACGIFERPGSGVAYPDYHKETDTMNKVNFDQVTQFGKAYTACVGEYAIPI